MGNCCCACRGCCSVEARDKPTPTPQPNSAPRPAPPIPVDAAPRPQEVTVLRALYDYLKQNDGDISFKKGEFLELVERVGDQWWIARHTKTGEQGYVPVNYLCVEDDDPKSQDCFFNIQRRDAERILLAPGSTPGQFIIRPAAKKDCYALSVRDLNPNRGIAQVKHYLIRIMENNRGYYIAGNNQFRLFQELLEHYKKYQDGLCRRLTEPAPRQYRPPPFRDFEVDRRCIDLKVLLGAGCFGEVYKAKFNDVLDVAVKTLKPGTMSSQKFIKEAQIMHRLNHPKIVQLLGVCTKAEPVYIIAELMPNGALLNYLQSHSAARDISFADQIDMAAQISNGMAYLENQRLVHRDLRAANILVGENNEVKIADFGLTTLLEDEVYTPDENAKFPVRWTAPEAMFHRQFSIKSDVWSFGVLLFEIITYGRQPYAGMSNKEVMDKVQMNDCMENPHNPSIGIHCPEELYEDIMKICWRMDPNARPTFEFLHQTLDNFETATGRQYDDQQFPKPKAIPLSQQEAGKNTRAGQQRQKSTKPNQRPKVAQVQREASVNSNGVGDRRAPNQPQNMNGNSNASVVATAVSSLNAASASTKPQIAPKPIRANTKSNNPNN